MGVVGERSGAGELTRFFHDLRHYVATARLLADQVHGDESALRERLAAIRAVLDECDDLVDQVVEGRLHTARLDLVSLVDQCVRIVQLSSRVPIDTAYAERAGAYGDAVLLRRAVTNVLDNAARAAGSSGRVRVQVRQSPGESWVEVADDGPGFARISSVSGHGMSVVDAAVRAAGGRLEIASGPGPGTTVRLRLPAQRGREEQ
jgi:signal transduction histidine kinase